MPMQEKVQKYFAGCVGPTITVAHKIQDKEFIYMYSSVLNCLTLLSFSYVFFEKLYIELSKCIFSLMS